MKKIASFFILLILISNQLIATEQVSDVLYYEKEKLALDIGWGHPSPLETYYRQNNMVYPFTMLSTANYRGHVATWEIENGILYITEVAINEEKYKPQKFNIKSEDESFSSKNKVFADWFNGVLVCRKRKENNYWETEYSIFFYVRNGVVRKTEKITDEDYKRIQNISEKDTSDLELMSKYSMLYLNESYISYYFRLYDKETIIIKEKKGYIIGKRGNSIILEYFNNDHMKWIYNWENNELSGAPNGVWEIQENKLFLNSINLHTGLEFDGAQKIKVDLTDVFKDKEVKNDRVLVDWANGIYIITHGEEIKDEYDFMRFKKTEYTLLRINNGIIEESHTVASDFNFNEIPEDTDPKLKRLLEDFKEQKKL